MSAAQDASVSDPNRLLHSGLSAQDAERYLKSKNGYQGLFLLRTGKKNTLTISVRRGEDVLHIKVYSTGEYFDVFDGSENTQFPTLYELLSYYWKPKPAQNPLVEKGGKPIVLLAPVLNNYEPSVSDRWFYGDITADHAKQILLQAGKHGSFLVRNRQSVANQLVLSVHWHDDVIHVVMVCQDSQYAIQAKTTQHFASLEELLEYYRQSPFQHENAGSVTLGEPLLMPVMVNARPTDSSAKNAQPGENYAAEFSELQKREIENMKKPRIEGQKETNRKRNRYKNILPYDHSRVILHDCGPEYDYINASYISVAAGKKEYIASQGCLPATVADFWRMIWQEKTKMIVMVTDLIEMGKNKCALYWPKKSDGKGKAYLTVPEGRVGVKLISETEDKNFIVSEFELTREDLQAGDVYKPRDEKRSVFHYHYKAWPDKALPTNPKILVQFLCEVLNKQESFRGAGPIVVHCSAGIGRTGTFIVMGFMLHQIMSLGESSVNVKEIVEQVRRQRPGMVQTEMQYKFLYDVIPHIVAAQNTQLYANLPPSPSSSAAAAAADADADADGGEVYQNVADVRKK